MANIGQTMFRFCGALVLAGGATLVDHPQLLKGRESVRIERVVPVVVAAKDIAEGSVISPGAVSIARWPRGTVPAGSYFAIDSVVGRVSRVGIFKGEAILPGRLAPVRTRAGLQVMITPGKRAYSIRINDVAGVAGMVQPNSRVDIMVVLDDPNDPSKRVARLLMSNMRVLGIGLVIQRTENGRPINATVATIEVTPEEAKRLAIAASQGSLQLALRGSGDSDSIHSFPSAVQVVPAPLPRALRSDSSKVRITGRPRP